MKTSILKSVLIHLRKSVFISISVIAFFFTLNSQSNTNFEFVNLRPLDTSGTSVRTFDLSNKLMSGVYFVRLMIENKILTDKFIYTEWYFIISFSIVEKCRYYRKFLKNHLYDHIHFIEILILTNFKNPYLIVQYNLSNPIYFTSHGASYPIGLSLTIGILGTNFISICSIFPFSILYKRDWYGSNFKVSW